MIVTVRRLLCATLIVATAIVARPLGAQEKKDNPALKLLNRDIPRHKHFLEIAKKGNVDVLFVGDSITQGWERSGKAIWKKDFEPLKAANFGIDGDQTGHVLWRLTEGKELEGITPKVAVVMIGTNNMGGHTPEQIAGGVAAIVNELHKQKPHMKVLLLAIFPRSAKATDRFREKIKKTNAIISKLGDEKNVVYLDIGDKFLEKDGSLSKDIMPDYLHPNAKGYEIWAEAIKPTLEKMLK